MEFYMRNYKNFITTKTFKYRFLNKMLWLQSYIQNRVAGYIYSYKNVKHNLSFHCWLSSSNWAAVILFMPSCTELKFPLHEWSKSRNCCHWALPKVRCIVLDTKTLRAAWSMRALTNFVFNTKKLPKSNYSTLIFN